MAGRFATNGFTMAKGKMTNGLFRHIHNVHIYIRFWRSKQCRAITRKTADGHDDEDLSMLGNTRPSMKCQMGNTASQQ
jgi:hypothetical protein